MSHNANQDTCISTYFVTKGCKQVLPSHISSAVKRAVVKLDMAKYGYTPDDVSSHSLRAGGAMALKLNGADSITIKKAGRWSSNTFMQYIHEQIGAFTNVLSHKMSKFIPFTNMGSQPTVLETVDDLIDTPN